MKIGLFIPSFFKYDAMGNDVYNMYKILLDIGYDVTIYANDFNNDKEIKIKHTEKAETFLKNNKNLIIYHHGVYTDFFDRIVNSNAKKIFRYHNITYPELFEDYDDIAVEMCKKGREQIQDKLDSFDYFLSCSNFNNQELIESFNVDVEKTKILAPFNNIEHWQDIDSKQNQYFNKNSVNILNVGRLSPNKNHQLLIKAFSDYNKKYNKNSFLHIVGKVGPKIYYDEIIDLINSLNIKKNICMYTEGIAEEELKFLYENSNLFVMTSKHEGFCVPIVESMFFSLPIISSSATALKDTVGTNGLVMDELKYIDFSIAMKNAIENENSLKNISKSGYDRFNYDKLKSIFISYIKYILE